MISSNSEMAGELSELFGESVDLEPCECREIGGKAVRIAQFSYLPRRVNPQHQARRQVNQTAIVLHDPDLDLPHFTLEPSHPAWVTKTAGSFGDLNFEDSPVFSEQYFLRGWIEPSIRQLFSLEVREYFSEHLGWNVVGSKNLLVVFKHNTVCPREQQEMFVQDALAIMELLQQAETNLDSIEGMRRQTQPDDIMATLQSWDGFTGRGMRKTIRQLALTPAELEEFLAASIPRPIPPGMKRQVLGHYLPFAIGGGVFFCTGFVLAVVWPRFDEAPTDIVLTWLMAAVFMMVGGLMFYFTMHHRWRKARLLSRGILAQGTVVGIQKTNTSINNQIRHHVALKFKDPVSGRIVKANSNEYALGVDRAREFLATQESVSVLIDPHDPTHVICPQLLMQFSEVTKS